MSDPNGPQRKIDLTGANGQIQDPPQQTGGGLKGGPAYIAEQLRSLAIPITSVVPDAANARKHGERNMEAIVASLSRFGQRTPIVVQRKGMVVRAGNGRLEAAKRLGWQQIAAVVVDDDSVEAVSYAIADNRTAELAEWDSETLASLLDTLPKEAMGVTGFSDEDLAGLLAELTPELGSEYTVKIESPIYEPKGIRPNIDELFNRAKTEALCKEIENASLPKPVADFLKYAAERHTVFDYAKIAEWYSHATESEQKMMQRSGLVIIDFDSAIENGFVEMTERIRALAASEEKESGQ